MIECRVEEIVQLFNKLFIDTLGTLLKAGGEEPLYLPRSDIQKFDQIISTHDYCSSALHEISHWCIAGAERRKLPDYGYWYEPDGRSESKQREFEKQEIKPQALEWLFSEACGVNFRVSLDNINNADAGISEVFKQDLVEQAICYLEGSMPDRADTFLHALLDVYQPEKKALCPKAFTLSRL